MTDKVKDEKLQVAEKKMVWHKPANLGVPSVIYEESLASVKIVDLPLPVELLATTTVSTVGEYFEFIRDAMEIPEAVIINPGAVDDSADPIASGIARRMQWMTASIDACTGRYDILEFKTHQVLFDKNLAHAPHVKMTFRNNRWTAWDWYNKLGSYQYRSGGLPQKMLDKHNSLTTILSGQRIYVPFGLDKGLFDWFQETLELPLSDWLIDRDARFAKLKALQNAYTAATDPMFAHKHSVKKEAANLDPGIYEVVSPTGEKLGERTYSPKSAGTFDVLKGNGYTFVKVVDTD